MLLIVQFCSRPVFSAELRICTQQHSRQFQVILLLPALQLHLPSALQRRLRIHSELRRIHRLDRRAGTVPCLLNRGVVNVARLRGCVDGASNAWRVLPGVEVDQ
jgi:hypothetical protein